ncbi:MAG: DUF5668 domain-containing protein [Hyphomicrobiaceae bacterium]
MRAPIPALILIALGVIFLGVNTGYLQGAVLATWWPLILITVGLGLLIYKR